MIKIDTSNWKEFVIGDLFDIHPTKAYKKINIELFEADGANPVIVNTGFNNGIGGYANLDCTEKAGTITFTDTAAKSVDSFFYQEKDFIGYPHVQGMYAKTHQWTRNESLFLNSVIKSLLKGQYDFIRKMTRNEMIKLKVKLPAITKTNGTYTPDWNYMEQYMNRLLKESEEYIKILKQNNDKKIRTAKIMAKIDTSNWKEFIIGDLFKKIIKPDVLHSRQVTECENGIPYVVRTKFNNGIKCYVEKKENMKLSPRGVISFGAENPTFFYQDEPFVSGRDIYYIDTQDLNANICKFLVACLQPVARKYSYNNGLFPDLLKKEIIKLPVCKDSKNPDWDYMEQYMENMINISEKAIRNFEILNF